MSAETEIHGIFDSHAHYDDQAFDGDRDELLSALSSKGVKTVINCGCSFESCVASRALAEKYDYIYFAAGVHPGDCGNVDLEEMKRFLPDFLRHEKCVGVGEIGLDYHYDFTPRERQKEFFAAQLEIAVNMDKPVIIHDREAHEDTMTLLKIYRPKGVMHCYSGGVEMMNELVEMGFYIGIGGSVTFDKAKRPRAVAKKVPEDRFLTETDCPYMTPVPFRGRRCDSSHIAFTAGEIAIQRQTDAQSIVDKAAENAQRLFGIK